MLYAFGRVFVLQKWEGEKKISHERTQRGIRLWNWVLLRYKKNRKAFAWTYERNGTMWVNVKVDPQWREFWRKAYPSIQPGYHQNKKHWNSIPLDGRIPDEIIKRMIGESYDLIGGGKKQ